MRKWRSSIRKYNYSHALPPTKILLGKGTPHWNMKLFHAKIKVNTCTVYEIGLCTCTGEDDGEIGVLAISRMSL